MGEELDPHGRTLADTNLFVAIGDSGRPKFERLKRHAVRRDVVIDVPERVQRELSVHPNEIRLQHAREEGWATVVSPPEPTSTSAVAAMDHVRRHIAHETGADEHDVEKADTVFAGLAVEYLCQGVEQVTVLTDDGPAKRAIENAVAHRDVSGSVRILGLTDVIGDEGAGVRIV